MRRAAPIVCALVAFGCAAAEPSEPGFEARRSDPEPANEAPAPASDAWYSITLPARAALAADVENDVIDAVYVVEPVSLTVLTPIARQRSLSPWATTVRGLFSDEPVITEERGSVGSVSAVVQVTHNSLRWVFVADGYGAIVKCWSTEPHDREWLHRECDPLMAEMSLIRPIHD